MNTSISAKPILAPEQVRPLLLEPTVNGSVVGQIATVQYIDAPKLRVPKMGALDVADWIGEGEEIPLGDVEFSEITFEPKSLKGGSVVTQEAMDDTSPEAAALIGAELARDLSRKIDAGFFGSNASNPDNQPPGLLDATEHKVIDATNTPTRAWMDGWFEAAEHADSLGTRIDAVVCHPKTATDLHKTAHMIDNQTGVGTGVGTGDPLRTAIYGTPIIRTPHIAVGDLWLIDKASTWLIIRTDAEIEADASVYFTSYRIALRSRIRATYGFTRPEALIKITGVTFP